MDFVLLEGDTLQTLKELDNDSVDSIVTDPPYGIKFMGKKWDHSVPSVDVWKEGYRVLKPGGYMLVACGTRTQHRMVVNIEDAGFEIRDVISWIYGSGFPKSHNISKAIDAFLIGENQKTTSSNRKIIGEIDKVQSYGHRNGNTYSGSGDKNNNGKQVITAPATEEAKQWEGWGTALKPATEFWTLCRKPLAESTVAENVVKHGTGGINIDGCRIATEDKLGGGGQKAATFAGKEGWDRPWMHDEEAIKKHTEAVNANVNKAEALSRFPSNLILDEFAAGLLDQQSGFSKSTIDKNLSTEKTSTWFAGNEHIRMSRGDSGGASRFFYVAKASKKERNAGLEGFELKVGGGMKGTEDGSLLTGSGNVRNNLSQNNHPTVKPINLMRYLVRLITPKGGICLDPYNGSGTTGCACALEDISYIAIDNVPEYIAISEARIDHYKKLQENNSDLADY